MTEPQSPFVPEGSKPRLVEHYEVLPKITEEGGGDGVLAASYTPNNGIRLSIVNGEIDDGYGREFDFSDEQAEMIGNALLRWAKRRRDERLRMEP